MERHHSVALTCDMMMVYVTTMTTWWSYSKFVIPQHTYSLKYLDCYSCKTKKTKKSVKMLKDYHHFYIGRNPQVLRQSCGGVLQHSVRTSFTSNIPDELKVTKGTRSNTLKSEDWQWRVCRFSLTYPLDYCWVKLFIANILNNDGVIPILINPALIRPRFRHRTFLWEAGLACFTLMS